METVLLFILGVAILVVGLALSIGLHEIGHLVPAKLFGVKVNQYMIGFGKTLFSFRRGETEYGVKAIPFGGYISMIGMFPPSKNGDENARLGFFRTLIQDARSASADTIGAGEEPRAFYRLPVYKRIIVMLGGPCMNLVIAVLMFAIVLCGIGTQQSTTTIASVSQCVRPATSAALSCAADDPPSPAAAAGIRPGDTLVSFGGQQLTSWNQLASLIEKSPNQTLPLIVERSGKKITLSVTPELSEKPEVDSTGHAVTDASGNAVTHKVGFLGVSPTSALTPQPAGAVLPAVGENISGMFGVIINLPQRLVAVANAAFGPEKRSVNSPIGLVGVGRIAGDIASQDQIPVLARLETLLSLIGSLNIALFAFNLVPLLPLDGGHIAGALWEGIRRFFAKLFKRRDPGPVDMAKLMPVTFAVVIVIGAMEALLLYADIVKPVNIFG